MLFADVATITIGLDSAGILATGIAGGVVGAAKLVIGYLRDKDKMISGEIKASREERKAFTETIVDIHREAMHAVGGVRETLAVMNERLCDESTGEHVPLDPDRVVANQQPVTLPIKNRS